MSWHTALKKLIILTFVFILKSHHCCAMQRASLSREEVRALVQNLYGLTVTRYDELNSYDDVNLHVYVTSSSQNPNITDVLPEGYVLKILNSVDSTKVNFIGKWEFLLRGLKP